MSFFDRMFLALLASTIVVLLALFWAVVAIIVHCMISGPHP